MQDSMWSVEASSATSMRHNSTTPNLRAQHLSTIHSSNHLLLPYSAMSIDQGHVFFARSAIALELPRVGLLVVLAFCGLDVLDAALSASVYILVGLATALLSVWALDGSKLAGVVGTLTGIGCTAAVLLAEGSISAVAALFMVGFTAQVVAVVVVWWHVAPIAC